MVPRREPPGGPEPQAIAAFVLCAAGQRGLKRRRADGVGGSLGCLLAHSFVRQGRAPGRLSITLSETRSQIWTVTPAYEFLATADVYDTSPGVGAGVGYVEGGANGPRSRPRAARVPRHAFKVRRRRELDAGY